MTPSSLDPRGQSRRGLRGGREPVSLSLGLYTSQTSKAILSQLASAGAHCPLLPMASLR